MLYRLHKDTFQNLSLQDLPEAGERKIAEKQLKTELLNYSDNNQIELEIYIYFRECIQHHSDIIK